MSKTVSKFVLAASIVLAMVFTFSCSDENGGGEEKFSYCIKDDFCHEGPYTLEACSSFGGMPSNNCPNGGGGKSSSSIVGQGGSSSSSIVGGQGSNSSSSVVGQGGGSSSSIVGGQDSSSSSSVVGQVGGSSSSVGGGQSSSSSSSAGGQGGGLCTGFVDGTGREHYGKMKKQFCDGRDGQKYVYVVIGTQTWMAENLNYNADGSKCYDNLDSNCETYGRLYNWTTAMKACPSGWHLPSQAEWNVLGNDAKKLKATSGWSGGNGTDQYGFSALPGGNGSSDGSFYDVGYYGYWWSASEYEKCSNYAYDRGMDYRSDNAGWRNDDKTYLFSVRCLQD